MGTCFKTWNRVRANSFNSAATVKYVQIIFSYKLVISVHSETLLSRTWFMELLCDLFWFGLFDFFFTFKTSPQLLQLLTLSAEMFYGLQNYGWVDNDRIWVTHSLKKLFDETRSKKISSFRLVDLFFYVSHRWHYHSAFNWWESVKWKKDGRTDRGQKKTTTKKKPWGAFVTLCEASLLYASLVSQAGLLFILMLPLPLGSGARVPGASGAMQNMACAQHCPLSAC